VATRARAGVELQPAFVLHTWPYSETSLLVDVFSRGHGRVVLVAKGARRPTSSYRGLLIAFVPIAVAWSGRGEVRTLTRAEWVGGMPLPKGENLLCGFYLNELLMRLLAREDPHEALFGHYVQALEALAAGASAAPVLRIFERSLLGELGYAMTLTHTAAGEPIVADAHYTYEPDRGARPASSAASGAVVVHGRTLLDLAAGALDDPRTAHEAKLLMRHLINHRLDGRALLSRQVFQDMQSP